MNCIILGLGQAGFKYDKKNNFKSTQSHFTSIYKNKLIKKIYLYDKRKINISNFFLSKKKEVIFLKQFPKNFFFDLAIVATPTFTHFEVLNKLISNNKINKIICEKPFTNSLFEAKKILTLVNKKKIILLVNYQRRYLSFFKDLKKIISKEKILKIECIYSKGIYENACHFINLLVFYFGNPKKVIFHKKTGNIKKHIRVEFSLKYTFFNVDFYPFNEFYNNRNELIFYTKNYNYIIKNNNFFKKKKIKNKLNSDKKLTKYNLILKENLRNYQMYVLKYLLGNNFFFTDTENNLATCKILEKLKNA